MKENYICEDFLLTKIFSSFGFFDRRSNKEMDKEMYKEKEKEIGESYHVNLSVAVLK